MTTVRLYHGTNCEFDGFKVDSSLSGSCTNSALGVHLTTSPEVAVDYAHITAETGGEARIAVVDVDVSALCIFMDRIDYLELDPVDTHERLTELRYDGVAADVAGDDELRGACVILDPEKVSIIEFISPQQAREIDDPQDVWDGVQVTMWPPPLPRP